MSVTTVFANDPTDTKSYFATKKLDGTVVIAMNRKTTRVTTRTCKLVELKVDN